MLRSANNSCVVIIKTHNASQMSAVSRFNEAWMPEPNSGCWLWTRGATSRGYGAFYDNVQVLAHRFSWMIHRGVIPQGLHVLHHCDTPLCVNPSHLFLGTDADNMRDKCAKGRARSGQGSPRLTQEQVSIIRTEAGTLRGLGRKYGVMHTTIRDIKKGLSWKTI